MTRRLSFNILLSVLTSLGSLSMTAADRAPRLLLNIVVEGLDNESLDILREHMGEGGFRRLENNGISIPLLDYGTHVDAAAATAQLVTGAAASVNGIEGEYAYDTEARRIVPVYADASLMGNYTNASYSPMALKVSTIADEARIASGGTNVAYSIATNPSVSLALAGHAANAAIWLDGKTANWASSTFYKEFPGIIATKNRSTPLSARMDTMSWTPSIPLSRYADLPDHLTRYPFRHVFPRANAERIDMFLSSPKANAEVTDVAISLIDALSIGNHPGVTDVLSIAYTLEPYGYGKNPDKRPELYDAYVRLDKNLEQLFSAVERTTTMDSTVVMLAATPRRPGSRRDDERWNIPYGEFSTRKAASLLNIYLMALYGNGDYVSGYHRGQFYLNRKEIKDNGLDIRAVRAEAAGFLSKMTGIDRVYTADDVASGHAGNRGEQRRRNTVDEQAGDLLLDMLPGFEVVDDLNNPDASAGKGMVHRLSPASTPAFIMAPNLKARKIETPVDARTIAPTIASILRIRSPNGASEPPLSTH